MKANELMIGDWVQDITPVVIDAISNEDICTYRTKHGYVTANPSNLKPILLTAEILEKNGFSKTTEAEFNYYQMPDDCFEIDINNVGCAYSVDVIIKYVHQLQHALRLCGIGKEIVL